MDENTSLSRRRLLKLLPSVTGVGIASGVATAESHSRVTWVMAGGFNKVNPEDGSVIESFGSYTPVLGAHPTQEIVYGADSGTVQAFDSSDGSELWSNSHSNSDVISAMDVSPDGSVVIVGDENVNTAAYDAESGSNLWRYYDNSRGIYNLAIGPDSAKVYTASWDGTVRCLNVSDGTLDWSTSIGPELEGLDLSEDGETVFVGSAGDDEALYSLNAADGSQNWRQGHAPGVDEIACGPDGSLYIGRARSVSNSARVLRVDPSDGSQIWAGPTYGDWQITDLEVNADSSKLFVCSYNSYTDALSTEDGTEIWQAGYQGEKVAFGVEVTEPEQPEPGPDGLFDLWNNYKAIVAAIVGAFALIGAWSKSLSIAAWAGYVAFTYIAFETGTEMFVNIAIVTLVMVFIGFAFKFNRLEMQGES